MSSTLVPVLSSAGLPIIPANSYRSIQSNKSGTFGVAIDASHARPADKYAFDAFNSQDAHFFLHVFGTPGDNLRMNVMFQYADGHAVYAEVNEMIEVNGKEGIDTIDTFAAAKGDVIVTGVVPAQNGKKTINMNVTIHVFERRLFD